MRIGIFGGSFNPVHNGHIHLAETVMKELRLDRIFLVPSRISPHRSSSEIAVVSPKCFRESNAVLSRLIDKESYAQTLFLFGAEQFPDPETLSIINK